MYSPFTVVCDQCDYAQNVGDSHEGLDFKTDHEQNNRGHTCTLGPLLYAYRIFTNDVGENAYSCLVSALAPDAGSALLKALETMVPAGFKGLAILDTKEALKAYGPNGKSGKLPASAVVQIGRSAGVVAGPKVA